jgi:hypothetical protein
MQIPEDARTVTTFNQVPVMIRPGFWAMWALLWGALSWLAGRRKPERSLGQRLLVGAISTPIAISADLGHALAHTESARRSGAPMDAVVLGADMPRTLYHNNAVPPWVHRLRALGGPIFNAFGLLISLIWRKFAPPGSLNRELADISTVSHGMIFAGSLVPLPIVDGGTILKWSLIEEGISEDQAEDHMRRIRNWFIAWILAGITAFLVIRRRK